MAGVLGMWNNWQVQVLVLVSFVLQVFLLMFAGMRWRNISFVPRTLLWLAYLLADSIAVYILGHMSFSSQSHEKQQLRDSNHTISVEQLGDKEVDGKWRERISPEIHVEPPPALARGAQLVLSLLYMVGRDEQKVLHVVLGVWVEMLCYAAHHCSRDSHARQLNSGSEFITIVWLLSSSIFNRRYCGEGWFREGMYEFFKSPIVFEDKTGLFRRILSCYGNNR